MKLLKRNVTKKLAAVLAVLMFLSSELPAYAQLVPQATEPAAAEESTEEIEREIFEYPEANIYEGEEGSPNKETPAGEEDTLSQEAPADGEDTSNQEAPPERKLS